METTLCHYAVLDNGVHEFVMHEFSRAGSDAFVEAVGRMNATLPSNATRWILVDSRDGVQPLSYLFGRLRAIPTDTTGQSGSKVALLMQPGMMVGMISSMMRIFPLLKLRIYRPEEREYALAWLTGQ